MAKKRVSSVSKLLNSRKKSHSKGKKNKVKNKTLTIFGSNVNGILGKKDSLISNIKKFQPGAFFLQETKVSRKGQIKVENYEIFEVVHPIAPQGDQSLLEFTRVTVDL